MVGNAVLAGGKIAVGLLASSASLVADGFHSLADLAGDVGILVALTASQRPADEGHPYGHHSFESLAALGVSLLMIVTGVLIGRDSVMRLLPGQDLQQTWLALATAAGAVLVKEAMARYTGLAGRVHNSPALHANAAMHRSDALSSIAAVLGIGGAMAGVPKLDSVAALVIAGFILKMGWELSRENVAALMDTMPGRRLLDQLRQVVLGVEAVRQVSGLTVRQRGSRYLADVSVTVDPGLSVAEGHDIAHAVESALKEAAPTLAGVLVHVEPDRPTDPG